MESNYNAKGYEYLEHPGDLKVRACGSTLSELFVNAARAMLNFLYGEVSGHSTEEILKLEVTAEDSESLLFNWLAEILYLSDSNKYQINNIVITEFTDQKIIAKLYVMRAESHADIKAVTYSELAINKTKFGWEAVFVCDL